MGERPFCAHATLTFQCARRPLTAPGGGAKQRAELRRLHLETEAAETHGYVLEGDAAPNIEGLADYTVAVRSDLGQTHAASSSQAKAAELLRETADFVAEAMEMDNDGMIAASLALWVRDSRPTSESEEALQTSKEKRQRRLADDLSKRALKRLDADKPLAASDARALRSLAREVAASARLAASPTRSRCVKVEGFKLLKAGMSVLPALR